MPTQPTWRLGVLVRGLVALLALAVDAKSEQVPRALLLAAQATRTDDTTEARSALLATLQGTDRRLATFLHGPAGEVRSLAFSPDGRTSAAGSESGTITLWDLARRRQSGSAPAGHRAPIQSLAFGPDGQRLASGDADGTILLWDMAAARPATRPCAMRLGPPRRTQPSCTIIGEL